ncbi:transmembrane protein 182 isoform X2 [Salmo salar]|uniref:Transmembrane protein 182 n=1 Tax=Salmo salar TaxID=8030 RepID=A0A1S3PQ91_SALSA|nr:transmembrane protein 182 isoform X2 [Salmo salar]|eukprot:XP_014029865.1 PREDICTED: transmembrane protein 182 isoform X2 [Salmo salar]
MKLSVALFFAGLFGALAAMFVLLSFGTDYWLLASETCDKETNGTMGPWASAIERRPDTTFYHEGFFWRCSFGGNLDDHTLLKFWITNQPHAKVCTHAYLFPFPVSQQTHNATAYDSAIIYRGFWSIFMLIGVAAVIMGGFFIICAAPFASHRLYKVGGGLFLMSALFLLGVVWMSVLWVELMDVVQFYVDHQRSSLCPTFDLTIHYGLSFFFAPVGISFCLLAGLLFLLIGRSVQMQYH